MNTRNLQNASPGIYDLGRAFTAHDVRKLRPCAICNHVGYLPQMLVVGGTNYHGGCLVNTLTDEQVMDLPREQAEKLRLNETGPALMMKLLDRTDRGREAALAQAGVTS